MNEHERADNEERRILERMPYLSELMRCIADVNQAIRQGNSAKDEADNLLSDLPEKWYNEIKPQLSHEQTRLSKVINITKPLLQPGVSSERRKQDIQATIHKANQDYARAVKSIVINLLYKKDLLLLTRNKALQGDKKVFEIEGYEDDTKDMD